MSFTLNMGQIMQYGVNIFYSLLPMIYLYLGAAFAIFIIFTIIKKTKGSK